MAPLREWLKPPKNLLLILFLLTLVSVMALAWSGWKLLQQDRAGQAQQRLEMLDQEADRMVATLRGTLAEAGDRLSAWLAAPPSAGIPKDGVLLIARENTLSAYPQGRLVYYPAPWADPEAPPETFSEGEAAEFQDGQLMKAAAWYRTLGESRDAAVRAGALLREARALRKAGHEAEARAAYARLAGISDVRVAGVPADLVARHELGDPTLSADLLRGRWHLTRGQFEFYFGGPAPEEQRLLAEAAAVVWNPPNGPGQTTVWIGRSPFLAMWRAVGSSRAVLIQPPQLPAAERVFCAAVDSEGRVVAGRRDRSGRAAIRTAAETKLPWTLYVTATEPPPLSAMPASQRYLLFGMGVMALFLIAGTYFTARAIRREIEVSRMQSDFVSAVSHEFRSPLTSIRQLSEILALGRAPGEERRQLYYDTLVRETARLQRLVEALLNFGRMEAGARPFHFEEADAGALVERVAAEFEHQAAETGKRIELSGPGYPCPVEADTEALAVALRNLIDNALKYSPHEPAIWVAWGIEDGQVAIRVRDRGAGITADERKAIFRKFVRGSAAAAGNVRGSGVGLAMVLHIVDAHHGEIHVMSEPGTGSTFTILLPAMEKTCPASS
ncbi:MAG TPA: HAMP domain-containing sensor histidine kinase [Candidatus Acidoferrales bacterium]|nr:HAMP domain-containing sensor histidine kinase [Candidatus Acidoferrales bacterium]